MMGLAGVEGIEPTSSGLEAAALPLNYTPVILGDARRTQSAPLTEPGPSMHDARVAHACLLTYHYQSVNRKARS